MKQGYKLYKKAKKVILGGNMLLSKRPEMLYRCRLAKPFFSSKKHTVWDLMGKYIDMMMFVGQNVLDIQIKK